MIRQNYGAMGFDAWWLDASEPELGGNWGELAQLQHRRRTRRRSV